MTHSLSIFVEGSLGQDCGLATVTQGHDQGRMTADRQACFDQAPPEARLRLAQIQVEVERRVPGAQPCIGYGMPAFRLTKIFFYFSAFKHHIGVYPPVCGPDDLVAALAPYRGPKGNLSFPHSQPLPLDLIGRTAEALARQYHP